MGLFDFLGDLISAPFKLLFPQPQMPELPKPPSIPELKLPKAPAVDLDALRRRRRQRGLRSGFGSTIRGGSEPTTGLLGRSSAERAERSVRGTLG
ncbi:MAG: hypothetical protein QNJ97_28670 [Myxococcota bacterium]|nr:hypothetical protein [Myxococcota bacterium]